MEFQEYPKALYRNGEYTAVSDYEAEEGHRAEGWTDWHTDQARTIAPQGVTGGTADASQSDGSGPEAVAQPSPSTEAPARNKGGRPRKVQ